MPEVKLARARVEPGKADRLREWYAALEAGDEEAFDIDERHHEVLRDALADGWDDLEPIAHFTNPVRGGDSTAE